jgi:hypothetical protein
MRHFKPLQLCFEHHLVTPVAHDQQRRNERRLYEDDYGGKRQLSAILHPEWLRPYSVSGLGRRGQQDSEADYDPG